MRLIAFPSLRGGKASAASHLPTKQSKVCLSLTPLPSGVPLSLWERGDRQPPNTQTQRGEGFILHPSSFILASPTPLTPAPNPPKPPQTALYPAHGEQPRRPNTCRPPRPPARIRLRPTAHRTHPEEWHPFYNAVWEAVDTGQQGRWKALLDLIKEPEHRAMLRQIYAAQTFLAHRDHPNVNIYSAQDAFGPPPPIEWVIPDLLARPSLNIIVGQPGSKKTLLALDLAACIALGKPWLGLPVQQTPTHILDMESGRPRIWARIRNALIAHGGGPDTPLYFQSLPVYDLQLEQHRQNIRNDADKLGVGVIIIDALSGLLRGADENNTASVFPILNNLRILSEHTNTAILVLHHMNKSGDFRGSSAIAAAVDLMLATHSSAESPFVTLSPLKAREASPQPITARAHFQPGRTWFTAEAAPPPSITNLAPAAVKLLHHIHLHGPVTTASILTQFNDNTPGTLRQHIHHLKSAGYLARTNTGGRGAAASYGLTPKSLALFSAESL